MQKLIVLGTGNAVVTKCYNTCFALQANNEYLLVDTGGGNGILTQLEKAHILPEQIHHIIITHEHSDHLLGIIWMIRKIGAIMRPDGPYQGKLHIYCHRVLIQSIQTMCRLTLQKKFTHLFNERILFCETRDNSKYNILGSKFIFFDIQSTKARQYGFELFYKSALCANTEPMPSPKLQKLVCLGDEPLNPQCESRLNGADWLLSEAFCLYAQREQFQPYKKHHSTVKEACEIAEKHRIPRLVLWHTEDKNYSERKALYTKEGKQYYSGKLYIPYDLEVLDL